MSKTADATVLEKLLDPLVECFTPEVARRIVQLHAEADMQARIDELAAKANEGELTSAERDEYEGYVEAIDVISILQAKARESLDDHSQA